MTPERPYQEPFQFSIRQTMSTLLGMRGQNGFSAFCLPMNSWEDTTDEKNSRRCANGLLLAKCAEDTFRRIGLFQSADVSVELFDRQTRLRELCMALPDQSEDTLPQLADRRTWLQADGKEPPIHQGIFCKGVQCLALKRQMHIRGTRHTCAYCKAETLRSVQEGYCKQNMPVASEPMRHIEPVF